MEYLSLRPTKTESLDEGEVEGFASGGGRCKDHLIRLLLVFVGLVVGMWLQRQMIWGSSSKPAVECAHLLDPSSGPVMHVKAATLPPECTVFLTTFGTVPLHSNLCPRAKRAGSDDAADDGGWWICHTPDASSHCVVYSFGIRDNFSFDQAMVQLGCEVHGFDPSPDGLRARSRYNALGAHYHDYGVGGSDQTHPPGTVPFHWPGIDYLEGTNSQPWTLRRIPTIIDKLRHADRGVTIIKMDVEGGEWSVIDDVVASDFDEFMVEFHLPPDDYKVIPASDGGFTVLRRAGAQRVPDQLAQLERLTHVAKLWKWEFNDPDDANPFGHQCLNAYFVRTHEDYHAAASDRADGMDHHGNGQGAPRPDES